MPGDEGDDPIPASAGWPNQVRGKRTVAATPLECVLLEIINSSLNCLPEKPSSQSPPASR
jgi:hypothetical protein